MQEIFNAKTQRREVLPGARTVPRPQRVEIREAFELSNVSLLGGTLRARDRSRSDCSRSGFFAPWL
jgi:hypothetical protein